MADKLIPTTDEIARELWERHQISDVMLRFGRGLDLHDWDMYAATLADPFEVDFFDLTGRAPATTTPKIWAQFASACLERLLVHAPILELSHQSSRRRGGRGVLSRVATSPAELARRRINIRSTAGTRILSSARRTAGRSASSSTGSNGATAIPRSSI